MVTITLRLSFHQIIESSMFMQFKHYTGFKEALGQNLNREIHLQRLFSRVTNVKKLLGGGRGEYTAAIFKC